MEIEENRGLINKYDYEDQFTTFCTFRFGSLSILSTLSYSFTLRAFVEHSRFGERKAKEGQESKDQARKSWIKWL